ncbi:ATP-binding protein [Desulfitobacterium sp. AusDCA]|uniref:ATP-binding protein n=1 Tax=Desulfitobacterium sp. AusDCA TaxID=3240383 RepID=UPI003DA77445
MGISSIPWWMRIKVHFLLFGVTMSILPLFFLGYLGFTSIRQNLEENIYAHNYEQVTVLTNEVRNTFSNAEKSLLLTTAVQADNLVGNNETLRQNILKTLLEKETIIREIKVLDKNLKMIDRVARQEELSFDGAEPKIETGLSTGKSSSISEVYFSQDGSPFVYLTVGIQDPSTNVQMGYMQSKIDLKEMINTFANVQLDQGKYIFLVDHSGNLIGSIPANHSLNKSEIANNPGVQGFIAGEPFSSGSEHKNQNGVKMIGAYHSIGTPNWAVFIEQPAKEASKPIYDFAFRLLIIAILIMTLVMILSISFGLKVVHPIENLEGQVRQIISTGNLESHIPIESWDEIGRLVQSFNLLLNSLNQKNEDLRDEKELLTTVVDGIGAGMILLNPEKKIIWWNTKFADWFGNQLENIAFDLIVHGEGVEGFCPENGRNITVSMNDERRHFRKMYYKLSPDNPENAAYLLLLEDVTQEVELEAHIIETDKMAAVGLLASGVAHEINNPLAIVAAHSEELMDRLNEEEPGPSREEVKHGFKIVLEQISRCKQITDRLLSYTRKRNDGLDLIDLKAASEKSLGLLGHQMKQKHVSIEVDLKNGLLVQGNENEWQQVMLNLISNALDASPEEGRIEVKGWHDEENVYYTIKDFGEGIPQHNLKKVLDPFFTTKSIGKGTGLGLYVSYGIIQKMQGNMTLESMEGQGTLVKITLPRHKVGDLSYEAMSKDFNC